MFFLEDDRKFFVRGVSYGPFRDNQMGEPFPEKRQVELDFRLLADLGANTLRVYHVPPSWICELADAFGLRLLVGIPWQQHIRFLDSERTRAEIRTRIRKAAHSLASSPNLLGLLVGNEISPQIVRWYEPSRVQAFLGELADEVRQSDPEALVSYANFPMTEYLELDFLDFASFNVYLHQQADLRRYLARLQNLAAFSPLVLTEFGAVADFDDSQLPAFTLVSTDQVVDAALRALRAGKTLCVPGGAMRLTHWITSRLPRFASSAFYREFGRRYYLRGPRL